MYPKESATFSVPPDRGRPERGPRRELGSPDRRTTRSSKGEADNIVTLVDNVRDANYYDPTTPDGQTYIAGFFYSVFNEYFDRNVMTIDAFDWLHRTGANPPDDSTDPAYQACSEELQGPRVCSGVPRPHVYEGTFAHEYQHLLESYEDADETSGSTRACRTGPRRWSATSTPRSPPDDPDADSHIDVLPRLPRPESSAGPENSLTAWGDQGGPEIALRLRRCVLLHGVPRQPLRRRRMTALHREDGNGLVGLDKVLDGQGATVSAQRRPARLGRGHGAWTPRSTPSGTVNGVPRGTCHRVVRSRPRSTGTTRRRTSDPGAPPNGSDYVRLRDGDRCLPGEPRRSARSTFNGA